MCVDKRELYHSIMQKNKKEKKNLADPIYRLQEYGNTIINSKTFKSLKAELFDFYPNLIVKKPLSDKTAQYLVLEIGKGEEYDYQSSSKSV